MILKHLIEIKTKTTFTTASPAGSLFNLGFSVKMTSSIAQRLYQGMTLGADETVGLISYMRTDSTNLFSKDCLMILINI